MRFFLEDLMTLDSFRNSEILAGKNGIENKISAANVLDSIDNFKYIKPEAFIFCTLDNVNENESNFISLLEKLGQLKVGALGIKTRNIKNELSDAVKEKADEVTLPIISISDEFDYSNVVDKIRSHIYCHNIGEFMNQNDLHIKYNRNTHRKGFYGVAELLHKFTGFNVLIMFGQEKIKYPEKFIPENFDYNLAWEKSVCFEIESTEYMYNCTMHSYSFESGGQLIDCLGTRLEHKEKIGYVWMFQKDRPFDESDYSLLGIAAYWCNLICKKTYEFQVEQQKLRTQYIKMLLQGEIQTWEKAVQKSKEVNWEIPRNASLLVIKYPADKEKEIIEYIYSYLYTKYNKSTIVGTYGVDLITIIPKSLGSVLDISKNIYEFINKQYINIQLYIGIGREEIFESFLDSFEEAKHAAKIGHANNLNIVEFEKLNLYRLISYPNHFKEMIRFYNDYYMPLKKFDETHESDLINTLKIFLNKGCSYSATAKALYFHNNTIRYRIKTIERLCSVDLKTQEGILSLGTALMIAPLISEDNIQ